MESRSDPNRIMSEIRSNFDRLRQRCPKIGSDFNHNSARSRLNSKSDRILPEFQLNSCRNQSDFHSLAPTTVLASEIAADISGIELASGMSITGDARGA